MPEVVGVADQQSLGVKFLPIQNEYSKIQICDLAAF